MPKIISSLELTLSSRPEHQTISDWLYAELRSAVLEGRLSPGARLPASRDFARQHRLSRGTVVSVFERLQMEGYLCCRVGSGTWVNDRVPTVHPIRKQFLTAPAYIRRVIAAYARPKPFVGLVATKSRRPFQMRDPDLTQFPAKLWGRIAARRTRNFGSWLQTEEDGRGHRPLREAIAAYLGSSRGVRCTPDHQFPLGMTMSLERRMALLKWASRAGAFIIEDDYDSEYRFEGKPVPALQSLDRSSNVILIGSFSKLLFPSLRLGYVVLPPSLVDFFLAFRYRTDFRALHLDQAVLCDFIVGGHLARHLRRMRDLYASRLAALIEGGRQYLNGLLEISSVKAGLYTAAFLKNGMTSRQAETAAATREVEAIALDRFTLKHPDPQGVLLGFAAFHETAIREGLIHLAAALTQPRVRPQ